MEISNRQKLSDFLDWVELDKAPPGPPPRPGLEWRERTSRWIRPNSGTAVVEDSPSSKDTDKAGIHLHTPVEMNPTSAAELYAQLEEFETIFESVMGSFTELFSEGDVTGRIKTIESVAIKIRRKGISFSDVTDVVGTRIEFPDSRDVEEAIHAIEQRFHVIEKERHTRKDGYYTAVHLILDINDKPVEVQIRTSADGKIASYAHDILYKNTSQFSQDIALIDRVETYLKDWSDYVEGFHSNPPDCPDAIRLVIGCLDSFELSEQAASELGAEMAGQESIASMVEKDLINDFKGKIFELIHKITAPKGKYRLVEVDEFSDPFETGEVINDFVFLEEAKQEQASIQQQNPTVKYFIYDEDSKVME